MDMESGQSGSDALKLHSTNVRIGKWARRRNQHICQAFDSM